jgi:hypothetical protein
MSQVHYIIGIGRSGTSLLMSILGSHREILTPPENYFNVFFYHAYAKKTYFSPHDIQLIQRFNEAFHRLQPPVGFEYDIPHTLLERGFEGTYSALCENIYSCYRQVAFPNKKHNYIIDKNPSNTLFLKSIQKLQPEAKYILMVRDYRANILSRKESVHLLPPSVMFNAVRWSLFTKLALRFKDKYPDRVQILRYEDLINAPEEQLDSVFQFLSIKPETSEDLKEQERSAYLKYKSDSQTSHSARAQKKYEDLAKPIFKDRVEKWKESLTSAEIELADFICHREASACGYLPETIHQKIPLFIKFILLTSRFKVLFSYLKDQLTYYLPISFKVKRFERFVNKVRHNRN